MSLLHVLPRECLDHHIAFLGKTGAGKSYAARVEVEELQTLGKRICIIDPTGVWWGLRRLADGSPRQGGGGIVILGGDHGDLDLAGVSGERIADLVSDPAEASLILDVSRLTVGARTRLFADFAERLAQVNRSELHLVIDEAHLFAPQGRVNDPLSGRMVGAANHLVSGGRALGLRIMLLSQRPAKLHKDSLTQVETLVALRLIAPQDRAAVEAWVGEWGDKERGRELVASLPSLPTGQGWVWAPEIDVLERIAFPRIQSYDSGSTPIGATEALGPSPASIDLVALAELLKSPPAEPAPARPSRAAAPRPASPEEIEAVESRAFDLGMAEGLRRGTALTVARIRESLDELLASLVAEQDTVGATNKAEKTAAPEPLAKRSPPDRSGGADKLLRAIRRAPRNLRDWNEVAILACMSPTAGYFRGARNDLLSQGTIVNDDGGIFAINTLGLPRLTKSEVIETWAAKVGGAGAKILRQVDRAGDEATVPDVHRWIGLSPTAGYTRTGWKKLRSNNLISESAGKVRLAPILRSLP